MTSMNNTAVTTNNITDMYVIVVKVYLTLYMDMRLVTSDENDGL